MTRKKTDKRMPRLEPQFHNVLVCKKNDCRPFLEVMIEEPENVSHQNLGTLVGIFQIDDRSEDSSYVVNYLISVIKKEYFSRANRGPVENFESALHKANLALAKLATHENIGWIGHINAICAVIEKNNLLLSQTGNATALLLRGNSLMEITELPDESLDSNPLKTFQDVVSGKIENNDKLIVTTKEIFDIFSLEEIKKSALKFSREKFVQFLNTALVNELDQLATLVIDIDEKIEETLELPAERKIEEMNVFSQTAFRKEPPRQLAEKAKAKEDLMTKERQEIIQELKEEGGDFVDKKTGHIYIKEPQEELSGETSPDKLKIDLAPLWEKISNMASASTKLIAKASAKTKESALALGQKSSSKIAEIRARKKASALDALEQKIKMQLEADAPKEPVRNASHSAADGEIETETKPPADDKKPGVAFAEKFQALYAQLEIRPKTLVFLRKTKTSAGWLKERTVDFLVLVLQKPTRLTLKLTENIKKKWQEKKTEKPQIRPEVTDEKKYPWETIPAKASELEKETVDTPVDFSQEKTAPPVFSKVPTIIKSIEFKKILPDFSRLKQITANLNQKQKISALAILVLLLVVPYWIVRWENKPREEPVVVEESPAIAIPLEKDLNVSHIEKLDEVYAGDVAKILNLNNKFFALTETGIIDLENKKNFSIASDFQGPELFVSMPDLKSIFLIKNDRIISFSPVTGKFQAVKLDFPPNGKIVDAKTYLTYIYLLDVDNNQIYRVPRAEGGFGEKTAWIKDQVELKNALEIAINDNIFVLSDKEIIKLFKYKKQPFSIENTATAITPDKLYTEQNIGNLYILDKTNSRIIKLDNDGKILAQYYNAEFANATDFSVSEENNLVYISDKDGVKSFGMN